MSENPIDIDSKNTINKFYPRENITLRELHDLFIKYKLHGSCNALSTINSYKKNFEQLLQFKPDLKLCEITEETIVNFLEYLNTRLRKVGNASITRTFKNSSIAIVRSKLNSFFQWLIERKYLEINPFERIPYPKISYTDKRAFSPQEFERICYSVNTKIQWENLFVKKRNIAIIMFLTLTGVRKGECLGLRLNDIEIQRKIITIRAEVSKSKITRLIPINYQLLPYLEDYLMARSKCSCCYLWVSSTVDRPFTEHGMKHLINAISKATGINCHLHRFRHTFAINYYRQTKDIVGLKKLMGHQSLKMTLSYLRSLPDEHVVEQINKMSIAEFL